MIYALYTALLEHFYGRLSYILVDMFISQRAPPSFRRIYGALSRPQGQKDSEGRRHEESFWPRGLLRAPYILRKRGGA